MQHTPPLLLPPARSGDSRNTLWLRAMQGGFTLVELLVVLAIVGFIAAGVSYSIDIIRSRDTEYALQRLRLVLESTAERAQARGRPIAFEMLPDGYRFSTLDTNDRWIAYEDPPVFTEKLLPHTIHWGKLHTAKGEQDLLVFGQRAPRFTLDIHIEGQQTRRLEGRATGAVILLPVDRGETG